MLNAFLISRVGYHMYPFPVLVHHSGASRALPLLEQYGGSYTIQRAAMSSQGGTFYVGFYVTSPSGDLEALIVFRGPQYPIDPTKDGSWQLRSVDSADTNDAACFHRQVHH